MHKGALSSLVCFSYSLMEGDNVPVRSVLQRHLYIVRPGPGQMDKLGTALPVAGVQPHICPEDIPRSVRHHHLIKCLIFKYDHIEVLYWNIIFFPLWAPYNLAVVCVWFVPQVSLSQIQRPLCNTHLDEFRTRIRLLQLIFSRINSLHLNRNGSFFANHAHVCTRAYRTECGGGGYMFFF